MNWLQLVNLQVFGKSGWITPDAISEFSSHQAVTTCEDYDNNCYGCLSEENCKFATFMNSETKCVDGNIPNDEIIKMKPNSFLTDVYELYGDLPCP